MSFLYVLSKFIFFPGTYIKAFFEHVICRLLGISILSAESYVSRNTVSGHIFAVPPETAGKSFFFCTLPGTLSFIVGFPAVFVGALTLGYLGIDIFDPITGAFSPMFIVYCVIFLFGASFFNSLFPHTEDAVHMWKTLYGKGSTAKPIGKIFAFVPAVITVAGAFAERYCVPFVFYISVLIYWIVT